MRRLIPPVILALAIGTQPALSKDLPTYRQWITDMKEQPRGPFSRLRWFCKDGTVLPPKPYACQDHGGGHQHGEWSERTETLREQGYLIASLLAGIDPQAVAEQPDFRDSYAQLLIERYLVSADDGWILRRALFYRGAIQEEDEREGGRALLEYLAGQPDWIASRYPALRIGVRLLPHGQESASAQKVRQESAALSDRDPGFRALRAKIHGAPDAGDAGRVRDYATGVSDAGLRSRYESLAALIDALYQASPLAGRLDADSRKLDDAPWLQELLGEAAESLRADDSAAAHYRVTARLLADLRDALPRIHACLLYTSDAADEFCHGEIAVVAGGGE